MNYIKTISLLFLFTALLFTSCRKDEESYGTFPPDIPTPEILVNGSFSGMVTDEANQAIENALVSFSNNATVTDENGYFSFKNVNINTRGSLVIAEKEGYFYNAKFVSSKLNKQNFTKFKLIQKTLTGSFSADAGGTVSTSDGAAVGFGANAIKRVGGGTYTGNVNVYATWLDPTAADLTQRMPGDLRATNAANEQQQLTTFGMIGVELEDDAGEALNIADGQTATIELPLPAELAGNAPSTIPLWHFDEATGYWIEEGEATLQGDKYVGTVSHFSFWNCDVPNDFIFIEGIVTNEIDKPLEGVTVIITEVSSGISGFDITNEEGVYAGAVPSGQELMISIIDNCGVELYSALIGPFSEDAIIPTIAVTTTDNFINLFGTLVDCDNNPVTNGYVKVDFGFATTIIPVDANGEFNELVSVCDATTIDITGFDLENLKKSTTLTQDITGISILDLANILVCEDFTEFMIFSIGDIEIVDTDPFASFGPVNGIPDFIVMQGINPDSTNGLPFVNIFIPNATGPGVYIPDEMFVVYFDDTLQTTISNECENMDCDVSFEFTTYEGVGGFIIGSFSGILEPDPFLGIGTAKEVSGTFKILIE